MKPKTLLQIRRLVLNAEQRSRGHCHAVSRILYRIAVELATADQLDKQWHAIGRSLKFKKSICLKSTPAGPSVLFDVYTKSLNGRELYPYQKDFPWKEEKPKQ